MSQSFDEKLLKLQKAEFTILKALRDYCESKSITYYLAFGTLLGAVRHQGFIPWDDDVDVFMPRKDYLRFLAEAEKDFPDWLIVRTYNNTKPGEGNIALQAKVEAKNYYVLRPLGENNVRHRIWIDIFILDGMPKSSLMRTIHYNEINTLHIACRIARSVIGTRKDVSRPFIESLGITIVDKYHIRRFFEIQDQFLKLDRALMRYDFDCSDAVIGYAEAYGSKCIVPRWCFGQGQPFLFEGELFNAPSDPDTLLKSWYGDYMTLPPEDRRRAKHCIDIIMDNSDETPAKVQTTEDGIKKRKVYI